MSESEHPEKCECPFCKAGLPVTVERRVPIVAYTTAGRGVGHRVAMALLRAGHSLVVISAEMSHKDVMERLDKSAINMDACVLELKQHADEVKKAEDLSVAFKSERKPRYRRTKYPWDKKS